MNNYHDKIKSLANYFDEQENKKYQTDILLRLVDKIKDIENIEIEQLVKDTYESLMELNNFEKVLFKKYYKSLSLLKSTTRSKYKLSPRGAIKSEFTGFGIAIGVAFGSIFASTNPAFIGMGIPIGLAIGIGIGSKKEKEAEDAGKTY